jgi:ubiquinone/menaquinone biosynthesis C-methylase UbiE
MQTGKEIINKWSESAPYWEKNREVIRQMFAPVTQALIDDARILPGHTVLDIATGPGEPALSVAECVGGSGQVIGIDPIPEMVDAARRAAAQKGVGNARFEIAFADHLPFADHTFDAVISRFGVMFFPSPVDGVREMLRVLKPGGRLALAVWMSAEANPFFHTVSRVIDRFVEPAPRDPDAADAFRFAEPGKLKDVMIQAGVKTIAERLLQFRIESALSPEEYWPVRCEMSESLRDKVAGLSAEQRVEAKRRAMEALSPYSTKRGMSFPAEVLIVTSS